LGKPHKHRLVILGFLILAFAPRIQAQRLSNSIDDLQFWRMVTEMSEAGGAFAQQYMSNEDSAQFVIPALTETARPGGVYLGVGLEQNFTYIAAIQPKLAFVVDIRRDNMLEQLMYKALFELSPDRADFLSRLLSRKRPAGLDANSSAKALFDAFQAVGTDSSLYDDNLSAVLDRIVVGHRFPLTDADKAAIARFLNAFRTTGPYSLRGQGDSSNPTYSQLMTATDLAGSNRSYLASEQNFRVVQALEKQNLIVPLVGDFAGDKTIVSVGRYIKEHDAVVDVFYVSNVERYLFDQGDNARKFYVNVKTLPLGPRSTFIRSVTSDISIRLGIPISDNAAKWRTFLSPMSDFLKAFDAGRIQTYRDLFDSSVTAH
jgi:hypothetical protein